MADDVKWKEVSQRLFDTNHVEVKPEKLRAAAEWAAAAYLNHENQTQARINGMSAEQRKALKPEQLPDKEAIENPAQYKDQKVHELASGGKDAKGADRDETLIKIEQNYETYLRTLSPAAQKAAPGLVKPADTHKADPGHTAAGHVHKKKER